MSARTRARAERDTSRGAASTLRKLFIRPGVALAFLTLAAGGAAYLGATLHGPTVVAIGAVETTVGDLRTLHAEVFVRGQEVRGAVRLHDGDEVKTAPGGRARIRLDDGSLVIVDGAAELTLKGERVALTHGRIFVQAGAASRTEVAVRDAVTTVVSSAAAFDADEAPRGAPKAYCARGELVLTIAGKSVHVASGETATLAKGVATVAPETAFDDWTGGLAVPWSGERATASAIAEVWGGGGDTDPGSPLVVRSEKIDVTVDGEVALTRTRTTYFNGSDRDVQADVRMALPEGAIVSHVARMDEGASSETSATLSTGNRSAGSSGTSRLEWAGGGWVRGTLANIRAGTTVELMVDYVEWLPEKGGRATYRFPMASDTESPMVGQLEARIGSQSPAKWLSASKGAVVANGGIELRKADVRPTGDLVVEMVPSVVRANVARAYVDKEDRSEDPYVLVRAELPEDKTQAGTTLALVLDVSSSVGPALLETERAAVLAILESLGPKDSVVVLAADQSTRIVGPDKASPVTPELRAQLAKDLAQVHAGGASNLGLALERAADLLDAKSDGPPSLQGAGDRAGTGMVVYLGDGRPTVGETDARDLRKRLARRAGGVPRLAALAVGQGADRWMLAELVAGAGPVYDVLDRPDAARASSALVADALTPTLRDVSIAMGATVDRQYPRDARTAAAGTTYTVAGRLRGALPKEVALRYRRGTELVEEILPLEVVPTPVFADVASRWAQQRIEESVMHADGIEPAIALANKARLLTPWTSWFISSGNASAPWESRLLGLSPGIDTAFAARIEPAPPPPSLLLEPPRVFDGEASIEQAAEIAARHSIRDSMQAMVACRDARASIKPGISGDLRVDVAVAADGKATKVSVSATQQTDDDPFLDRCVRVVVNAVPFFGSGVAISFTHFISLPPGQTARRTECSVASTLPLAVRRGIWRARKAKGALDYSSAAHACELPTWGDRRALLGILVAGMDARTGTAFASRIEAEGETDAAAFVRQELIRQTNLGALDYETLRRLLIDDEPKIDRALDKAFRAAKTDDGRLSVLRRFLRLAPHSPLGRRLLLSLLEGTKNKSALLETIEQIRNDVFADAGLLADCASALRRQGMDEEGRRAFGELVERAPRDPWTLGYVGDRLRAEGLYEDALAAYLRLDAVMPDDPAVSLRLALAHAGAGRLDVATRLLDRVAQTGGRGDDGRLGELASVVSASLIAKARQGAPGAETDALLARRLAQTPLPDVASMILVRTPLGDDKVEVAVARQLKDKDELPADLDASAMGLSAVRIERGGGTARIHLKRAAGLAGSRPTRGLVTALVLGSDRKEPKLVTREVDIPPDEKGTELRWTGEAFE
jgi:tetratricopeptide (TPR) repeat protein